MALIGRKSNSKNKSSKRRSRSEAKNKHPSSLRLKEEIANEFADEIGFTLRPSKMAKLGRRVRRKIANSSNKRNKRKKN